MNKNLIIAAGVIAIIAVLGAGYYFMNRSPISPQTMMQNPESASTADPQESAEASTTTQSLKSLMEFAGNEQCTFSDPDSKSSGSVYVGGGKARGDFQSDVNGTPMMSHMISDGAYVYIWTDGQTEGYKSSLQALNEMNANAQESANTVDVNKQVDYSCRSWAVDSGMFAPPANVTFQDFGAMMQGAQEMMEGAGVSGFMQEDPEKACSACDGLPADAQAACKTALKCN